MKKMIICCADMWTEELITMSRLKKISYFVEEKLNVIPNGFPKDKVFSYEKLLEENKDNVIIIISNSKRYGECAERLTQMGFIENEHFFNGWKLHINYYKKIDELISWEDDEKSKQDVFCNTAWEKRAEFMASMIPSNVKSIMDIGCGDKKLKKYLNQDIKYYGLDFVSRGGTIVCNINKDPFPDVQVDMYYLAGVIPYVNDIEKLIKNMSKAKYILVSLQVTDQYTRLDGVLCNLPFTAIQKMNNDEIINCMYKNGFVLVNAQYNYFFQNCHYYLFKKMKV